jgi:NAD(P)-dependent dehydrogenase (short-subunit alcohol dehydrogenase family)
MSWTSKVLPDQASKTFIVTGATSGLGLCCAEALAAQGAHVIMAVRDIPKGEAVADRLRAKHPGAYLTIEQLDLASLRSVAAFAGRMNSAGAKIDVLLNNAGLGLQPERNVTEDGFERQFGTNHLGHFALTAQLVPALLRTENPRVVTVSSIAHRRGAMQWQDPNLATGYDGRVAYGQSKLANLMFALELAERAAAQSSRLASLAAHPGLSRTGFVTATHMPAWKRIGFEVATRIISQSAEQGSLPLLYAAAMPDARNGEYWGPGGFMEINGSPARAKPWPQALVAADRKRLWDLSESMTGVAFPELK